MSNPGQAVSIEVWADCSAQLACESASAFGLLQKAVGPCHRCCFCCPIPGTSAAPLLSGWLIPSLSGCGLCPLGCFFEQALCVFYHPKLLPWSW